MAGIPEMILLLNQELTEMGSLCEEIISRHNGELTISNADDEAGGCLVEIRLPTGT